MKKNRCIKINLLYYKFEKKREQRRSVFEYSAYLSLVLLLLLVVGMINWSNQVQLDSLQSINADLEMKYKAIAEAVDEAPEEPANYPSGVYLIDPREGLINVIQQEQLKASNLIEEIYIMAQPDIIISQIDIKKHTVSLSAYGPAQSNVIAYLSKLQDNPRIKEINQLDSQLAENEVYFSIVLTWGGVGE